MNANELADELEYACGIAEPRITMMERMKLSATMLRAQQAEIEALKAKHHEALMEIKTSWTAVSPASGIPREAAHKLYEVIKDILK